MKVLFGSGLTGKENEIANMNGAVGILIGMAITCMIAAIDNRALFYIAMSLATLVCLAIMYASYKNIRRTRAAAWKIRPYARTVVRSLKNLWNITVSIIAMNVLGFIPSGWYSIKLKIVK
jgi:high-affinity Fe2+/Pb2+ permease